MKRIVIFLFITSAMFFLVGCSTPSPTPATTLPTATPTAPRTLAPLSPTIVPTAPTPALISVSEILKNPTAFRDQHVHVPGYGFTTATIRLCEGYVGLDRRTLFVDAQRNQIVAQVKWKPPENARMYDPDHLRVFAGYVRIFSGEIGCPGSIKVETFPYLEVVDVQ